MRRRKAVIIAGCLLLIAGLVAYLVREDLPSTGLPTPKSPVVPRVMVNTLSVILLAPDGSTWIWPRKVGRAGKLPVMNSRLTNREPVRLSQQRWQLFAANDNAAAGVKPDGSLWLWGRLPIHPRDSGMRISTNLSGSAAINLDNGGGWTEIFLGPNTAFVGLKKDGSLWCYGANENGQLGQGTNRAVSALTELVPGSRWRSVDVEGFTGFGIRDDGSLWYWGAGDGSSTGPVRVGTQTNWVKISTGLFGVVALKSDGSIWTSAPNSHLLSGGQKTFAPAEAVQIGSEKDWDDVKCDADCFYAVKKDGTCWVGGSNYGQLLLQSMIPNQLKQVVKISYRLDPSGLDVR